MRNLLILLTVVSLYFSFTSCKNVKGNKCSHPNCTCGDTCLGDSCKCGKEIIKDSVVKVTNANLYLDNSKSMKGYTEDMTYINVITQLWKAYPNTQVLKCADKYKAIDEGQGSVVDQLKKLAYSSSSLLQDDFSQIIDRSKDNNIAFYVTDGILSGEANKIDPKKGGDRKWTIKNAANLKLQIQSVFEKAKAKGIGLSVYQFISTFKGIYYCYTNIDNVSIDSPRYFYVFVIGKPHALLDFKARFVGEEYFRPKKQLHFIDPMPIKSEIYSLDVSTTGQFSLENILKKQINTGKIEICIKATPLKNNFDVNDKKEHNSEVFSYIAKKIVVTVNGKRVSEPGFAVIYDEKSHIFKFLITPQLYGNQIVVDVSAPYNLPAWVKLSNFFDDNNGDLYMLNKHERDSKTFMLLHLIDGIRQGLLNDDEYMYHARTTFFAK